MKNDNVYIKTWSGLCNRLRVMISFGEITNKPYNIIWDADKNCPYEFDEMFVLKDPAYKVVNRVPEDDSATIIDNGVRQFRNFNFESIDKLIEPNREVYKAIEKLNLPEKYNSVHIRTTDFHPKKRRPITEYNDFINNSKYPVYVACDDVEVIKELNPDKIITHNNFIKDLEKRKTGGVQAAADLWICKNAESFLGNRGSSFTDFIQILRQENPT